MDFPDKMKNNKFIKYFTSLLLIFSLNINPTLFIMVEAGQSRGAIIGQSNIVNGGFEEPDLKSANPSLNWKYTTTDTVPGWETTSTDNQIEFGWMKDGATISNASAHMKPTIIKELTGTGASNGVQFAEVVANEVSSLYQSLSLTAGENYNWTVHHRGRGDVDTLAFIITDDANLENYVKSSSTSQDHFQQIINWMKDNGITAPESGVMTEYTVYTTALKESASFEESPNGCFSFNKDSEHNVEFKIYLMSSGKTNWSEYTGNYLSNTDKNILFVLSPFQTSYDKINGGNLLDNMSFTDSNGNNLLVNASFDDVVIYNPYSNLTAANSPSNPQEGIGWCTTATDYCVEIGNFEKGDAYNLGTSYKETVLNAPYIREGSQFVELNAQQESSLYQVVDTVPGKMYRWSLSHRGREGLDTMALIIGPNQDYAPKKANNNKNNRDQLMQIIDWLYSQTDMALDIPQLGCSEKIQLYSPKFNSNGGYELSNNIFSFRKDDTHTEEWSVWIISSMNDMWHDYGEIDAEATYNYDCIIPEGQNETIFGFVSHNSTKADGSKDRTYGNLLDNIAFKEYYYVNVENAANNGEGKLWVTDEGNTFIFDDESKSSGWALADSNVIIHIQESYRELIGAYINDKFIPKSEWTYNEELGEYTYVLENVNSPLKVNIIYVASTIVYDSCSKYPYHYDPDDPDSGYEFEIAPSEEYISHEPTAEDGWKFVAWKYFSPIDSKTYLCDAVHKVKCDGDSSSASFSIHRILENNETEPIVEGISYNYGVTFFAEWKYRQRVIAKTFNKDTSKFDINTEGGTVELSMLVGDAEEKTKYVYHDEEVGEEVYTSDNNAYINITAHRKIGYTFNGWYDKEGNLVSRNASYVYKVESGKVEELYAYFEPNGYDVIINSSTIGDSEDLSKYFEIKCTFSNLRENSLYVIAGLSSENITIDGEKVTNPITLKSDEFGNATITIYMKHDDTARFVYLPENCVYSIQSADYSKSGYSVRGEVESQTLLETSLVELIFYKATQYVSIETGKHYEGIVLDEAPEEITITEKSSYTLDVETRYSPSIYTGLNISLCFCGSDETEKEFFTGTRILMIDMSDDQYPNFYSYTVNNPISEIPLTDFTELGSTNNFTLSTDEMYTEKLVFIVDYVGTQNTDSGKISLVYRDDNNELAGTIPPIKKLVTIGEDTTQLTATALGNGNASNDGPFSIGVTVNESYPAVNTTYEGNQNSKYAMQLSPEGGTLPDGSYAVVGENKYYSNNGYITISPFDATSFNMSVYSPVPLELVDNKVTFQATLLSAISTSASIPVEKITSPIEFNCVEVAIDADVTDKVLNPSNVSQVNVKLKNSGIDEAKLTISKKNSDGTYDDLLTDIIVDLPPDDNSFNVGIGNEFTAIPGETYIFSFVGYLGGLPVCKDECCVVCGYIFKSN